MLKPRVIPCLLLKDAALVKTIRFENPSYVGDPGNAIRIFNEKEVDELIFVDITAGIEGRGPAFDLIERLASECFMPLAYGGGITSVVQMRELFRRGVEKVSINSAAVATPELIREAAGEFGNQAIVISIDAARLPDGSYEVRTAGGRKSSGMDPRAWAETSAALGAGEILLTSIDRDGTLEGYDLDLIRQVSSAVDIPVIACGGAGKVAHLGEAVREGGASAVAMGSMVVYFGRNRAVLISFPSGRELARFLS
ncbi:MAG: AglZ/HisF2 family acetamidino modification protein [Verrucomicrobiota bacterium]